MTDIKTITIAKASELLESGILTSVELCSLYLKRIEEIEEKVKAFVHIDKNKILKQAEVSDVRRKNGTTLSSFDGIPVAVKDLIAVKGEQCTCGSKILRGMTSPYDATVVSKLREKGAVLFGRNNMDEFAMGSTCENSSYYPTKNPWDLERVPGGSSGGSAAAVASSEVLASLGSDTGGSVRQPAAFCGVVGLKPTYGTVSRFGLVAYASSLDQIGPITKDVYDSALLYDLITGHDPKDSTSLSSPELSYANVVKNVSGNLKGLKVGIPKEYFGEGLSEVVRNDATEAIALLKDLGADIVDISLPYSKYAISSYYIIATAEASANLARFDGIRYGFRSSESSNLMDLYLNSRREGFGTEVKRRILLGTFVLSSGYYDAYYLKAQKIRTLIKEDFNKAFAVCDVILSPASPYPPFKVGEITDPLQMYLADIFTISINLAGICAISVPSSIISSMNVPLGVQFIGPARGEDVILKTAKVFEDHRAVKNFVPNL
ncbi:MAG TPA: Asp-tRNA(Asn)/Glu-tRNA(Gln) amidotransferase GatCAB subunit A [Lentisphaeria bacterium]|nr:MAG: aspartyl/glutamyl-tRNA amidotransferase subunit A [Lentisphaerae bacterium GWF2_38_69]HBM16005.1 Asp-tRNA(Asn)/Glu-tRNA(Gln) amidotransferase GatCAB subunit A [Lentisphaeria bacterium]